MFLFVRGSIKHTFWITHVSQLSMPPLNPPLPWIIDRTLYQSLKPPIYIAQKTKGSKTLGQTDTKFPKLCKNSSAWISMTWPQ